MCTERKNNDIVIILVYVDDMLITGSNKEFIEETKQVIHTKFRVNELGELQFLLASKF